MPNTTPHAHLTDDSPDASTRQPPLRPPFIGRSRALRSNWCWYQPDDLLIDAGDGVSVDLGGHRALARPKHVLLTHGHGDHLWGLPALLLNRSMPSLEGGEPLSIYWPAGNVQIERTIAFLRDLYPALDAHGVSWHPITLEWRLPLNARREVVPFQTRHIHDTLTMGYAVVEHRTRLRPELRGASSHDLAALRKRSGADAVTERHTCTLFAHTGDTMPVNTPLFHDAQWVIYDGCFLDVADRDHPTHATVDEALEAAATYGIRNLVLHHLSLRYDRATLQATLSDRLARWQGLSAVWLWDDSDWTLLRPARQLATATVAQRP